jgi:hypothetical protein
MFISDRLVYLQLQKTGCTHVAKLLGNVCSGIQIDKHNRLSPDLRQSGRSILGSVRDPWDWYVSLWAFGCSNHGGLHHRLVSDSRHSHASAPGSATELEDRADWRITYSSVDNPSFFKKWLRMIHDPCRRYDLGEGYAESPISLYSGFYTYRYAYLYSETVEDLYSEAMASTENLRALIDNNVLDFTIHNERLEDDLLEALEQCGIKLNPDQVQYIRSAQRTNASPGRYPASFYYDEETIELVHRRDAILIDQYGYTTPNPAAV